MKLTKIMIISGLSLILTAKVALAADPTEIPAPIEKIFVPSGFDDNDNAEVVLQGTFHNTCYRVGHTGFSINEESKQIKVWATSYKYSGACAMVMTPFIQVVKFGMLKKGNYSIKLEENSAISRNFSIKPRNSVSADDYLYAPVSTAAIIVNPEDDLQYLELAGRYPKMENGCAKIIEIRTVRDDADIVVVQPIMEMFEGEACENHELDFKVSHKLTMPFYGKGLLHVRVLNGNAKNQYIEIDQ